MATASLAHHRGRLNVQERLTNDATSEELIRRGASDALRAGGSGVADQPAARRISAKDEGAMPGSDRIPASDPL